MDGCMFCLIAQKKISANIVYEDENSVAFLDKSPLTRGHALVVPKNHFKNIYDIDDETIAKLAVSLKSAAKKLKAGMKCGGMNVLQSSEKEAGQEVYHIHFHLIPRYDRSELAIAVNSMPDKSPNALMEVARQIEIMNQPSE